MKLSVWVIVLLATAACSGGNPPTSSNSTTSTTPKAPAETEDTSAVAVKKLPGGVVATACRRKYPIKSWDDRETRYAFCERLGYQMASCTRREKRFDNEPICVQMREREERRMDILHACLSHDFDESKVPEMIATMEECICGSRYADEKICKSTTCQHRLDCLWGAGFDWSPVEMDPTRF